ncbi:MAG: response regulator transcription factor [Dehalococcoidales bacterium]|nr:response regulator transcription factor [Dehalococcoidales bacterium]
MARKILIVDDEKKIAEILKAYLEKDGYSVIAAYDGNQALEKYRNESPDLILLDIMLPEISGLDVCREIRRESTVPVIMLTALDETTDKIVGLELGADDYVTKPFDPKEIISRVRAVLRRTDTAAAAKPVARIGDITIDTEKHAVRRGDNTIDLTAFEFEIYSLLSQNPGRVYSRSQLLDRIQGDSYEGYERTIDTHIKNIRKKLGVEQGHPGYIITVYGVGYKLTES